MSDQVVMFCDNSEPPFRCALEVPIHLQDYVIYDESSPTFLLWKKATKGKTVKGSVAGTTSTNPPQVKIKGRIYIVSRVVYKLFNLDTEMSGKVVDHKNGDILDNNIDNLRLISQARNNRNKGKTGCSVLMKGVCIHTALSNRTGNTYLYFRAYVYKPDGSYKSRNFSVATLGVMRAHADACAWRVKEIEKLQVDGAGYTDRHLK